MELIKQIGLDTFLDPLHLTLHLLIVLSHHASLFLYILVN